MTSAQVIVVAVSSALVAVFTMLVVATIRRARARDDDVDEPQAGPGGKAPRP